MGKHSKNSNDRAFFSYAERRAANYGRHSSGMLGGHNNATGNFRDHGWGSQQRTVDGDSMKDLDACSLSLQPCVHPVVTPNGVIYDKQVIIEFIISKKKELERAMRDWERQEAGEASAAATAEQEAHEARIEEFVAQQEGLSQADMQKRLEKSGGKVTASTMGRKIVGDDHGKHASDMNFWVPTATPEAKVKVDKPDTTVRCPITGEPLRLKQLHAITFTPADGEDVLGKKSKDRYICPLSKKGLSNVNPATVLRPSGMVVASSCVKDFIKKEMLDPFTDPPCRLKEKDIIPLRVEGTGYAAKTADEVLSLKVYKPVARY